MTQDERRTPTAKDVRRLLRLAVPVVVKLAGKRMNVRTVTDMRPGTMIQFDKVFDDELELMIRDKVIGFGKAVKVGEKFGLRITSMCDIHETIRSLGE